MRKSYLESYYDLMPISQRSRLLNIIQRRIGDSGTVPDAAATQDQLTELIAQLKKPLGSPMIQLRKAVKFGKLSSKDYNDSMDEAYVDLGALYQQNNKISKTIKVHELINDAAVADVTSALQKLENDIIVSKIIKENKSGITDVVFNSFYKDDNVSTDQSIKTSTNVFSNSIRLPIGVNQSSLYVGGSMLADIELHRYGGGIRGILDTEEHLKEMAIDGDPQTFWAEVILTDEPIKQTYDGETVFGAVCEVEINLFRADLINHIRIDPFANYPLDVIRLLYKSSENSEWAEIDIQETSSTSLIEFDFPEVLAKAVKVVLNQKNPSINSYKIPKRVINNAKMWQQIVDREYSISTDTTTTVQATQDMIDYITGWQAYVDAHKEYEKTLKEKRAVADSDASMSESIFDAATEEINKAGNPGASNALKLDVYKKPQDITNELVEVRKYEYLYGAYEIDVKRIWYIEKGEYISPAYTPNGTVLQASISVSDVQPQKTSIEYSVTTRPGEWKNILPSGNYISGERVLIDSNTLSGTLRFPCSGSIDSFYRNSIEMPSSEYSYDSDNTLVTVASGWYTGSSSFTADYEPDGIGDLVPSGTIVDFSEDPLNESTETFSGSQSRQYKVELSHYPFPNFNIINDTAKAGKTSPNFYYTNGRWYNISGHELEGIPDSDYYDVIEVFVDGHRAEDRTDYYNGEREALVSYNQTTYPNYEFNNYGKSLYLNSPIENKEIKVKYKYLNDYIQFRAILRNNDRGNVSSTPIVNDFTIKMRTL